MLRAVYLHGFLTTAVVGMLFPVPDWLVALWKPDIVPTPVGPILLVMAIVAPCASGMLVCSAAGDRRRGYAALLSGAGLVLTFAALAPNQMLPGVLAEAGLYPANPSTQMGIVVVIMALLFALAALRPLVHLRARPMRRIKHRMVVSQRCPFSSSGER